MKKTILILALLARPAEGGTVGGRVIDAQTREPLPGVNILLRGTLRGVSSDTVGRFMFSGLPAGSYALVFSLVGYQRASTRLLNVAADDSVSLTMQLTPIALQTEPVVVTAARREQSFHEAPTSVSVMDAAGIGLRNFVTVDDALRYVPGVNMTEYQVNIRGSSGYSRGAGSRVLMLLDGIPFLTGDTGEINFESIPIGQVERIEVVKGAASALYGSGALGGVINVITKPIPDEPETRIRMYGGVYGAPSYSQWDWGGGTRLFNGVALGHSHRFGPVGITVYGSRVADDGYRQNDSRLRYNAFVKTEWGISSYDDLKMTFNLIDQRRASFLYWKNLDNALVPTDDQQGQTVSSTRYLFSGAYTHAAADLLYTARAIWFHNHFSDTISQGGDDSRSDVLTGQFQVDWTPVRSHALTFGLEGSIDRVKANLFGNRKGNGGALFAQDEILLFDPLRLTLGARFDLQSVDSLETTSQLNPKAAVVYTPTEGTALRASAGRGFRAPSVAEAFTTTRAQGLLIVPNPSLKPERSYSYEIGVNQIVSDKAVLDVALFETDYANLIESGFNAQGQGQFSNVTKARVRGIEAGAKISLLERKLFVDVDYTYVSPWDLTSGDVLKYRPRHLLYASILSKSGRWTFGVDIRHLSRVERIDEEFVTLGIVQDGDRRVPITVADLRCALDLADAGIPLTATLSINNLFQYNYVELIGNLAPPRSFVLTIDGVFH